MKLVLIGGKSAERIKDLVLKNFDSVEVSVFKTTEEFVEVSGMRSMKVDRIILLQDAFNDESTDKERLEALSDYLSKWFPATKIISVVKSRDLSSLFASVFLSPLTVHLKIERMSPTMLTDLVSRQIDEIKNKYKSEVVTNNGGSLIEDFEVDVHLEGSNQSKSEEEVEDSRQEKKSTKKRGKKLFGLFGKKEKKVKKGKKKEVQEKPQEPEIELNTHMTAIGVKETAKGEVGSQLDDDDLDDDINFSVFGGGTLDPHEFGGGVVGVNKQEEKDLENGEDDEWAKFNFDEEDSQQGDSNLTSDYNEDSRGSHSFDDSPFESDDLEPYPFEDENTQKGVEIDNLEENNFEDENTQKGVEIDNLEENNQEVVEDRVQELGVEVKARERIEELQNEVFTKQVKVVDLNEGDKRKKGVQEQSDVIAEDVGVIDNLDVLSEKYAQSSVKVVEKVIEVEKVVERVVTRDGKVTKKLGPRVIVVTGDRKSGLTRTSLALASLYAKRGKTLFVDFDLKRSGSLHYIGLEDIIDAEDMYQSGITTLKTVKMLSSVTYKNAKEGYDCLLSLYGTEYTDEVILRTQRVLSLQKDYSTVIIDCPLENLHYLQDIVLHSEILICVEPLVTSIISMFMELARVSEDEKFLLALYNNSNYLLTRSNNIEAFNRAMDYVRGIFSLDEEELDWSSLGVLGSTKNIKEVLVAL